MADINIVSQLLEGQVTFKYTKSDGSVREATGTLNETLIPADKRAANPTNTEMATLNYFDLGVGEWRAFRKASLIG